jgi:hypothetical protein
MVDRFCKDCKHARPERQWLFWPDWNFAKCALATKYGKADLVTGVVPVTVQGCGYERTQWGACNADAKLWEPRDA